MHSCLIESTVRYAARAVTFYLTTARYVNQQFLDSGSWTVQEYPPSIFVTINYAVFFYRFRYNATLSVIMVFLSNLVLAFNVFVMVATRYLRFDIRNSIVKIFQETADS